MLRICVFQALLFLFIFSLLNICLIFSIVIFVHNLFTNLS
nr:MAG TPA: hypothetical protein [Caudoviricetes sp.]